ncbi:MAG: DUF3566 domain-containing protein [Actinobacteria bacterium]|nr:DUF3566 domain-containing protein [Actinomycetota bacterium]
MEVPIAQRRVVKSISEFSVFKIALIVYLIIFILNVILAAIFAMIMRAVLPALINNLNNFIGTSGVGSLLSVFGVNIPDISSVSTVFGTNLSIGFIVITIVAGLLFSVPFAAIAAFWAWIFNVIIKISGGIEVRYIDRTARIETKAPVNTAVNQ